MLFYFAVKEYKQHDTKEKGRERNRKSIYVRIALLFLKFYDLLNLNPIMTITNFNLVANQRLSWFCGM